jgi:hypothetical protein
VPQGNGTGRIFQQISSDRADRFALTDLGARGKVTALKGNPFKISATILPRQPDGADGLQHQSFDQCFGIRRAMPPLLMMM